MALLSIEGSYTNGHIDLKEQPSGIQAARVIVTFLLDESGTEAEEEARRAAMERLFAQMDKGIDLGGQKFDRNALYEERMQELEARRKQAK